MTASTVPCLVLTTRTGSDWWLAPVSACGIVDVAETRMDPTGRCHRNTRHEARSGQRDARAVLEDDLRRTFALVLILDFGMEQIRAVGTRTSAAARMRCERRSVRLLAETRQGDTVRTCGEGERRDGPVQPCPAALKAAALDLCDVMPERFRCQRCYKSPRSGISWRAPRKGTQRRAAEDRDIMPAESRVRADAASGPRGVEHQRRGAIRRRGHMHERARTLCGAQRERFLTCHDPEWRTEAAAAGPPSSPCCHAGQP
jgi:hypothetical protein